MNMGDVGDLRSAAVRSLQKQKKRQTIANKLEKSSNLARNQQSDGSSINNLGLAVAPATTFMGTDPTQASTSSHGNADGRPVSFSSTAKKRQSTFFGALDPSIMEELAADLDDD